METLGTLCLGVILVLGLLIAWAVLQRLMGRREAPPGTYDDKKIDSGGSIGGMRGGRSYDRPDIDSGGTIGGQRERRAHDHPDIDSGGSIGGGPSVGKRPRSRQPTESAGGWDVGDTGSQQPSQPRKDEGRVDHPDIKSGGSFGG